VRVLDSSDEVGGTLAEPIHVVVLDGLVVDQRRASTDGDGTRVEELADVAC